MEFKQRYRYDLKTDLLGKGGFARVYKAYDTLLDRHVAIKVFPASDDNKGNVLDEIKKAIRLHHPNLLQYFDVALLEGINAFGETEKMQIGVMEYANYSDLKVFTRTNPSSPYLDKLLVDVMKGIGYLHSKNIIHRDLKPQNILLVKDGAEITAKISDFGISKFTDANATTSSAVMGTIEYMAPEQFNPVKYGINGKIGTNLDIWSFGIMLYELISNQTLFGNRSANATAEQIMVRILSDTPPAAIDTLQEPYKTIVKKCLVADANKRITNIEELIPLLSNAGPQFVNRFEEGDETMVYHRDPGSGSINFGTAAGHSANRPNNQYGESHPPAKKKTWWPWLVTAAGLLAVAAWFIFFSNRTTSPYALAKEQLEAKDTGRAFLYMQQAHGANNDSATLWLANYYFNKVTGTKADAATAYSDSAIIYFEVLADKKNAAAQYHMGQLLAKYGFKGFPAREKALDNFSKAAAGGYTDAEYELGEMYIVGSAINKIDSVKGFTLTKLAAEKSHAKAQTNLGYCYLEGIGTAPNMKEAFSWYVKAADAGNAIAQFMTARLYEEGEAVSKDMNQARYYYQLAAGQQYKPAIQRLQTFSL